MGPGRAAPLHSPRAYGGSQQLDEEGDEAEVEEGGGQPEGQEEEEGAEEGVNLTPPLPQSTTPGRQLSGRGVPGGGGKGRGGGGLDEGVWAGGGGYVGDEGEVAYQDVQVCVCLNAVWCLNVSARSYHSTADAAWLQM